MKLSTRGRYAVMAMVDLAIRNKNGAVPLADIADRQNISRSYLEQLFKDLRKNSMVRSVRGPGGGYILIKDPSEVTIADIILSVDNQIRMTRCVKGLGQDCKPGEYCSTQSEACLTHHLWVELGQHIRKFLGNVTLDDVSNGHSNSINLEGLDSSAERGHASH